MSGGGNGGNGANGGHVVKSPGWHIPGIVLAFPAVIPCLRLYGEGSLTNSTGSGDAGSVTSAYWLITAAMQATGPGSRTR